MGETCRLFQNKLLLDLIGKRTAPLYVFDYPLQQDFTALFMWPETGEKSSEKTLVIFTGVLLITSSSRHKITVVFISTLYQ